MKDENYVLELVDWLERAAHHSDFEEIMKRFREGLPTTCRAVGVNVQGLLTNGPLEIVFKIPISEFQRATRISNAELTKVKEYLATIPDSDVTVMTGTDSEIGEVIVLTQSYWVPSDQRPDFIDKVQKLTDGIAAIMKKKGNSSVAD